MIAAGTKTILIVDDTIDTIDLFDELLRSAGCETFKAFNGVQAVEQARRRRPNLILMDIRMPVMDGYEAARRIHEIPELTSIPIVALSAHCEGQWRENALRAGCVDCLAKPTDGETLLQIVAKYTGSAC